MRVGGELIDQRGGAEIGVDGRSGGEGKIQYLVPIRSWSLVTRSPPGNEYGKLRT